MIVLMVPGRGGSTTNDFGSRIRNVTVATRQACPHLGDKVCIHNEDRYGSVNGQRWIELPTVHYGYDEAGCPTP